MPVAALRDSLPDQGLVADTGSAGRDHRLLLVDDDPQMVRTLLYYFEKRGFTVTTAASMADAKTSFALRPYWSLVVVDFNLPDGNGWDLFCWIREQTNSRSPFLLVSGPAGAAVYAGRVPFLAKPFSLDQLQAQVQALLGPVERRGREDR